MYGAGWRRPARDAPPAALAAVVLGVLTQCTVVGLARFGFGLLLPSMRADLEAGYAAMGAVATAGFLGHMAGSLLAGVVAVRRGSRPVLVAALALAGLATIATGSATSVLAAGLWQLLAGTGGGGAIVAGHGLVMGWFTPRRRGIATGIVVGGGGIGLLASGLLLPPVLAAGPDAWRIGWVVLGAPALLAAAAAALVGRDAPGGRPAPAAIRPRVDLGADGGGRPEPAAEERRDAPAGAVTAAARHELPLARHPGLWVLALVALCWALTYIVFMTFFAAAGLASGLGAEQVGRLWLTVGVLSSCSAVVWGAVSDRLGRLPTLALVYVLQGLACAALGLATTAAWFYAAAGLFGLGGWATPALVTSAGADLAGRRLAPAVLGVLTLVFGLGQAVGPLVAGLLNDATGGFAASSLAAAAVLFAGAVLALGASSLTIRESQPPIRGKL